MARPAANPADVGDPLRATINQVHTESLDYAEEVAGGTFVVLGSTFGDIQTKVDAAAAAGAARS
jgi:hypothetical protein